MSNQLLTISQITREALMVLENNCAMLGRVNTQYDNQFAVNGAKIGSTVNVRVPPRFTRTTGPALQVQDATETYVPVTLTTQYQKSFSFSGADLSLSIDEFSERFLRPAMASLANDIDYDGLQLYKQVYNQVGTSGTTPNTALSILNAGQRLDEEAAPMDQDRSLIINPAANATLVDALKGLFNPTKMISDQNIYGYMGEALGFEFFRDQNVAQHTYGACAAHPTTNGAQSGSVQAARDTSFALTVNAINNTITAGTVVTLSNVYAVNPQNRQTTGALRQFVVTADAAQSATTLYIYPVPVFSGSFQNVTSATGNIASGATVTLANVESSSIAASVSRAQNLAFHKNAFTFATADLPLPGGVDMAAREVYKGISMTIVRQFDIISYQYPCRIDVLAGWKAVYPELACRLTA